MKYIPSAIVLLTIYLSMTPAAFANKQYNQAINNAELAIISKEYDNAEAYYQSAFTINKTPLAADIQNALINAVMLKSSDRALVYANILSSLGAGREYFEKKTVFEWLHAQAGWNTLLEKAKREKTGLEQKNAALLAQLREMTQQYEQILSKGANQNTPADTLTKLSAAKAAIEQRLLHLFRRYGYLSEYRTGLHIESDTIICDPVFTPIIRMSYMRDLATGEHVYLEPDSYASILIDAEEKGMVSFSFIEAVTMNKTIQRLALPRIARLNCSFYLCNYNEQLSAAQVDIARSDSGLCNYQEYVTKLRYNIENQGTPFLIWPQVSALFGKNRMDTDKRLLNTCTEVAVIPGCR